MRVLDATGQDVGPLLEESADRWQVPVELLLALCIAESELDPDAARLGEGLDVSFGFTQVTLATAAGYGVGDGQRTASNLGVVATYLSDPGKSVDLGARILRGCLEAAGGDWLQALIAYNSGSVQPEGNWYWQRYQGNIARYRDALTRASNP